MLSNLFPNIDYSKLKYDTEGLYSITNYNDAEEISNIINESITKENISILDGTGGIGGNTISFSKFFNNITSIELNNERYKMLVNNIYIYDLKNVYILNCDSVEYLFSNYDNYNVYFFDPPWGGPNYKKSQRLSLSLGSKTLLEIAIFLKNNTRDKLLVYKLPYNYDFNEFSEFTYKLHKINKYYIIVINI
jgi:16S rRNA G966 N2-methylase RsmD